MGDPTLTKVLDDDRVGVADTVAAPPSDASQAAPPAPHAHAAAMFRELGAGDFQLRDEVARGGMGRVIRAFDRRLQRVVAIKLLVDDSLSRRARFAREARITAQLQHPSIVPVYDAGTLANGDLAYAMKLVSGRELGAAIADAKSLADRLPLLPRMIDVADAIAYAHAHRVIHRDLKPSNIILGEFGETIVIDWGIAKELDAVAPAADAEPGEPGDPELTRAGTIVGTPAYMAPEQALADDRLDDRADVYALGAILYELLAGKRPYDAADSTAMLVRIAAGPPPPLEDVEPHVPRALAAIVHRAMARAPGDRYTASELAAELRRFMAGQLVAAHRYSVGERFARWLRRRKEAVAVAAIALAVIAVGAVGSATRILRERDAAEDARAREAARADELLVARAATLATSDPIAAVGLLHQLPPVSASWRAARDVLAAARLHGVPWVFPVSPQTLALAVARDGSVAYAAGDDGAIRRLDLARGDVSIVRRGDHGSALATLALVDGDRALAIETRAGELDLLDLATGTTATVPLSSPVVDLVAGGAVIAWADHAGAVWSLRRGDPAPRRVAAAAATAPATLAISPDGAYLASVGATALAVYELAAPADAPPIAHHDVGVNAETACVDPTQASRRDGVPSLRGGDPVEPDQVSAKREPREPGPLRLCRSGQRVGAALAWSGDGRRLAIATFAELAELDLGAPGSAAPAARTIRTGSASSPIFVGDDLYFKDAQTVLRVGDRVIEQVAVQPEVLAFGGATRDAAVLATLTGAIAVIGRGGVAILRSPAPRLVLGAAAAGGSKLVVAAADRVFAYDAADVVARPLDTRDGAVAGSYSLPSADRLLVSSFAADWRMFDLATGAVASLGAVGMATPLSAPDGAYVLARRNRELVLARAGRPIETLGDTNALAGSPDRFEIVAGSELLDVSLPDLARRTAWQADEPIVVAATTATDVAAATTTTLWRRRGPPIADATGETVALPHEPSTLALAADGTVYVATGRVVDRWDIGAGALARHAELPRRVAAMWASSAGLLVARDDAGALWTIAGPGAAPSSALPDGVTDVRIADAAPIAIGVADGELRLYDLETHGWWSLGAAGHGDAISPDGRRVVTTRSDRAAILAIELADDRASYDRALDAITNLRIADTTDRLVWPAPSLAPAITGP